MIIQNYLYTYLIEMCYKLQSTIIQINLASKRRIPLQKCQKSKVYIDE